MEEMRTASEGENMLLCYEKKHGDFGGSGQCHGGNGDSGRLRRRKLKFSISGGPLLVPGAARLKRIFQV